MRRLFCLLLLICLPLQSFAAQVAGVRVAGAGAAHVLAHASDLHHHHHDDGQVHYDDSSESARHTHDASSSALHLLPEAAPRLFLPALPARADRFERAGHMPNPYLDDPQRPPASAPGLAAGG